MKQLIVLKREDIERVYDELDRRIKVDIKDGTLPSGRDKWIWEERAARLQGVYGTLMVLVPNSNWRQIVQWKDDIEEERYGSRVW